MPRAVDERMQQQRHGVERESETTTTSTTERATATTPRASESRPCCATRLLAREEARSGQVPERKAANGNLAEPDADPDT